MQGATSYTQPDLSGAPGFKTEWNLQPLQGWVFAAAVTTRPVVDLVGTASPLPSWPLQTVPEYVLRSGPTTDGLDLEIPGAFGTAP